MSDLQLGVVGLGLMGHVHAGNAADVGARVVAGADAADEPRAEFAEEFGARTYEEHGRMLEEEHLDAVVVTTPNRYHEPVATAALDGGCSVLIEKPLAHSLESARAIAEATRRSTGTAMVGFHNRFAPASRALRGVAESGRFGTVEHVEATYFRRRGIPAPGSWFTNSDLAGGGALIDVGVHVIDLAMDLLGFPAVAEVTGVTRTTFGSRDDYADPDGFAASWEGDGHGFDVDDSVTAFVRFETGQSMTLQVAWAANRPPLNEVVVHGTEAGAKFELEGDTVEVYETRNHGVDHHVTSTLDASGGREGHLAEMDHFLQAVAEGRAPTMNTIDQGLAVQRIVDGIYRSSETGGAVRPEERQPVPGD